MRVIVAEKNKVARRIAQVLSGGRYKVRRIYRVPVYEFDGTAVIGLSGHVLNLDYPVELRSWSRVPAERLLDAEPILVPTSRRHLMALRALFKKATEIVIATDYDREGELIGYEVVRYLAPEVPVRRAKFSSLTAEELRRAFENLVDLNEPMAKAGEARQRVDLSWGASLTRLLSVASGRRGRNFLSIGRVQTPTLALIVAREREIESHVPRPYWSLFLVSGSLRAAHVGNPFWERSEAEAAASRARVPEAEVVEHEVSERGFIAPAPYDTNTFLRDASRILGMAPHRAMRVAEDLYARGLISYPRTDNTAYPRGTPFKRILASLREPYRELAEEILSGPIRPRAGRKRTTDHPPIHPVSGADLDSLDPDHRRVYDLIVRRFLATLMPPARLRESRTVLDAGGERFVHRGREVVSEGWLRAFPFYRPREEPVPRVSVGDRIPVDGVEVVEDKTKPPPRYTVSELLRVMEELGLGTKSTRHEIIRKLYERKYVYGNPVRPTALGRLLIETLEGHDLRILKPEMTARLEEAMDRIERGETSMEDVVSESQRILRETIRQLRENEEEIAKRLKFRPRNKFKSADDGKQGPVV